MSYPDPPPPPSFTFLPYGRGEFLPPTLLNQELSELNSQFDNAQPFKRQRGSENNQLNPAPFPPMNPRVNFPTLQGKGMSPIFYKTRVCLKNLEGKCRNGEHCRFAHGAEDLREPPPNWQDLVRGKDENQRINQRVKICKKFYIGEECPYGENCNYLHEHPPNFKSDMVKDQRESSAITIETTDSYELEMTKHSFWKTRLCRKFEITGQCPYGERCNYAHGQSELKAFSGKSDTEGDLTNLPPGAIPINPLAIAAGESTHADQVELEDEKEEKKFRLWKLNKKISGIYGDWIDELNPPHLLSSEKDDI